MYNSIITYIGLHCNAYWLILIILPKENVVIWFCSLPSMFVFNSVSKVLDDTPQSKSKVAARCIIVKCNRQKGSTECGPLKPKRFKALRIQWTKYYLKVKNET
ncbi:hypothetical protein HKD37_04G010104 [Glycine soja]